MGDFSLKEARRAAAMARAEVLIESQWMHRERGSFYWVQTVGIREEDGEPLVVYRDSDAGTCWVRPASEFLDGRFIRVAEPK